MLQRKFIPGSEWIYFKLYTGTKTADRLLSGKIADFVRDLTRDGAIDKFFFIRYSDPYFHIRLRLHILDPNDYTLVFSRFLLDFSECVDNGSISSVMCDTYVREIERYGADTMLLSEDIFHIDSEAILSLLSYDESQMPRWHQALLLVDDMIGCFIPALQDKRDFTLKMAGAYKKEFGFTSGAHTKQLNDKYRTLRHQIEEILSRKGDYPMYAVLECRKDRLSSFATKLEGDILGSHIHMCIDRLFRSKNRLNEMVVYDYLNRHYESMAAREKYQYK